MKYIIMLLFIIPGMTLGWALGTFFIGIVPTLMIDSFITNFHYSNQALDWVHTSGKIGMLIGGILAPVLVYLSV